MNHIEKLEWRYATKEFDATKKLSEEQVKTLAESLRLAASSFGLQPWTFYIISNDDVKQKLLPHSWNQKQVVDCSHQIVFCTMTDFGASNVEKYIQDIASTRGQSVEELEGYSKMMKGFLSGKGKEEVLTWAKNQVYIALGSFLTTCAELEIDACPMEGIVQSEYDSILGLKDKGLTTVVACPVGFRAEGDKYAELSKVRFPLEEVVKFID
ncbi:NAD(P)H-dependent oxidoreductase [Halobacteriovorax sp.]|uniref:NAD(P)H-dependent oxidoreductase n=1 Tax=Halobacteriovorax sp. TaxID=2020862 RepID=UPI0035623D74